MLFPSPRTHLVISKDLEEGTDAFKAALKAEVASYFTEIGKPLVDTEFEQAVSHIENYRFIIGGIRFTYYRQ